MGWIRLPGTVNLRFLARSLPYPLGTLFGHQAFTGLIARIHITRLYESQGIWAMEIRFDLYKKTAKRCTYCERWGRSGSCEVLARHRMFDCAVSKDDWAEIHVESVDSLTLVCYGVVLKQTPP